MSLNKGLETSWLGEDIPGFQLGIYEYTPVPLRETRPFTHSQGTLILVYENLKHREGIQLTPIWLDDWFWSIDMTMFFLYKSDFFPMQSAAGQGAESFLLNAALGTSMALLRSLDSVSL